MITVPANPLAQALREGRFTYVVELVASGLTREWRVLEVAARLARVPQLAAASVTSYAGGALGHDPIRIATAVRSRGLTPNVHVTCVAQDRHGLRKTLEDLHALGLHNVFALTGDWPQAPDAPPPVFDLDAVQLIRLVAELRAAGMPFHVAAAVSPFKYVEADCRWQYLKLEKKIAAGADVAITQVGWDARKFAELIRYLRERGLATPVLGNVYVLGRRAAEKMAGGQPPGCWVPPGLLDAVRRESEAQDGGLRARLERAARTVAVLRGLGYAGAYLGGTHDPDHVAWIIRRAERLAPEWRVCAEELRHGAADGFYLYGDTGDAVAGDVAAHSRGERTSRTARRRQRVARRIVPTVLDRLGTLMPVTRDTWLRRRLAGLAEWIDRRPAAAAVVERVELAVKRPAFGCQACGNCVLGHLEYVCPQTCPKQMRNGPCGGTHLGRCEVVAQPCIWTAVWDRAAAADRTAALATYVPAPDRSLAGTSSWINYLLERDARPRDRTPHA